MLVFDGVGGLVFLAVWIFCFIDVLTTPETACRNLPKLAWVFIVLLLPFVGSIAWLVAGHPWDRTRLPAGRSAARNTAPARGVPTNPDDDDEFLAGLKLRAEEQRRRAREQAERDARDASDGEPG